MINTDQFQDSNVMLLVKYSDLERIVEKVISEATAKAARRAYDADALLSPEEVQKVLSISPATLSRWQSSGYIHTVKVGGKRRFRQAEVNDIKEGRK